MLSATQPAPPEVETLRTFINSVDLEQGVDALSGPDGLEEWCRMSGLCLQPSAGDLQRLRGFREALRGVLEANAGSRDPSAAWALLEPFAREASYRMRVDAPGTPALDALGDGAGEAIAALLAIVYDAVLRGTWPRLKACRKESCRWAFYDRSKNGSRAWCSMAVCGNRTKANRRRNRTKILP